MTQRFGCILAAVALLLTLTACKNRYEEPTGPSEPTLPSVALDQSPAQQLAAAIDKTKAAKEFELHFGTRTGEGEALREDGHSQWVSPSQPPDMQGLYELAPELPDRADFLEHFCGQALTVSPSNTGMIRYLLTGMEWEQTQSLLYEGPREAPLQDAFWTVTLGVDGEGRFSEFEITGQREGERWSVFLTVIFPEDQ